MLKLFCQLFSLLLTVTHAATCFMHMYQQKEGSLQEFNFELSELIQVFSNSEPKDITDPLKMYMYAQKVFNPAISAKNYQTHASNPP